MPTASGATQAKSNVLMAQAPRYAENLNRSGHGGCCYWATVGKNRIGLQAVRRRMARCPLNPGEIAPLPTRRTSPDQQGVGESHLRRISQRALGLDPKGRTDRGRFEFVPQCIFQRALASAPDCLR